MQRWRGVSLVRQQKIKAGHYIGTGKAEEISDWIKENRVSLVVFDDDLSPAQGRNLQRVFETRVLDRTQLILDIFAQRAQTKEGCLQVELAQHQYLLPRLRNMWSHLERQKGGIGLKGPGETQLEMDRRRIQELIRTLKRDLELVRTRRSEQRRGRRRHGWALVSLVGYTNAGKVDLAEPAGRRGYLCGGSAVLLRSTRQRRQVELPNHEPMLMTDHGWIYSEASHHLVDSFKATLEEVVESDLLVHVIDASHPQVDTQIEAVHKVLDEIGGLDKPMLYVFNKIDDEKGRNAAKRLSRQFPKSVAVSALSGEGIELLQDELADCLKGRKVTLRLSVPAEQRKADCFATEKRINP